MRVKDTCFMTHIKIRLARLLYSVVLAGVGTTPYFLVFYRLFPTHIHVKIW